ncbi:unnamed protein product [Lupinus luteus]|uniref:Wax synthase domain-containing protein n=1 Tax=Lupinus luteus TaxID=3873 RepID=A0AAV1Y6K6_LUPLU
MEGEIMTLAKVCFSVFISLSFCYWIGKHVPAGTKRLLSLLPIICLYLFIPLNFSSVHLTGTTGFFFAWLVNFKLLLFAFDQGPLSSHPPISLSRFLALASFPIKIQSKTPHINSNLPPSNPNHNHNQPHQNVTNKNPSQGYKTSQFETNLSSITPNTKSQSKNNPSTPFLQYAIKTILLAAIIKAYDYSDHIHPKLILGMYCFHIYFMLELMLATIAAVARTTLGLELEPQFKEPLMSTSLQDFWGKRWNLMVTSILRPTVYEPTLRAAKGVVGPKWAPMPAVLGTFIVSGLMHEVILYYMGRVGPSFKMMGFFVLHGLCLMLEIMVKKSFVTATWKLPRLVSGMLTVGFVGVTCFWLFLPEFIRCRIVVKAFEEYTAIGAFVKNFTEIDLLSQSLYQTNNNMPH